MTTEQRIEKIAEELRDIYKNTNEGPRLIHDLVKREFPFPRRLWNDDKGWGERVSYSPSVR